MKVNDTSPEGEESWEIYLTENKEKMLVEYGYRTPKGLQFSIITRTLEEARERRNAWLQEQDS